MIVPLTGLAVGIALGYVSQRGAFCLNSGLRFLVTKRDPTKMKAYGLAVAVQMVLVPLVLASGLSGRTLPSLHPVGAIVGGLLFGASMHLAGGCATGVWYKAGAGSTGALVALAGTAIGAALLEVGPLSGLRRAIQGAGTAVAVPGWWAPIPLGAVLAAALLRSRDSRAGAWSWRGTGLAVGLLGVLAWPLSSLAGRDFGLAVIPATVSLATSPGLATLGRWDALLLVGLPLGAFAAARRDGPVRFDRLDAATAARRFAGGLGLGTGSSLAAGCTVGHGLTGVPLLAFGSIVTMAAISAASVGLAALQSRR